MDVPELSQGWYEGGMDGEDGGRPGGNTSIHSHPVWSFRPYVGPFIGPYVGTFVGPLVGPFIGPFIRPFIRPLTPRGQ